MGEPHLHLLQLLWRPLALPSDRASLSVGDPAHQPQRLGLVDRVISEIHALNLSQGHRENSKNTMTVLNQNILHSMQHILLMST